MKKALLALAILLGLGLAYIGLSHFSGGAFPTPAALGLGGDEAQLRRTSMQFMEDIEFKDFEQAASYHSPETQKDVDIPFLIQRLFKVKPEALDIMEYEPVFVKIDSSKLRARVNMRVKVKLLATEQVDSRNFMLYYVRESLDAPWFMVLEDSLREGEAAAGKKH